MSERTVRLRTSGMHCRSCAMNIDLTLGDLDGVASSETDLAAGMTVVAFDDDVVDVAALIAAVKDAGYDAELEA